jgi:hypothetical protein
MSGFGFPADCRKSMHNAQFHETSSTKRASITSTSFRFRPTNEIADLKFPMSAIKG